MVSKPLLTVLPEPLGGEPESGSIRRVVSLFQPMKAGETREQARGEAAVGVCVEVCVSLQQLQSSYIKTLHCVRFNPFKIKASMTKFESSFGN